MQRIILPIFFSLILSSCLPIYHTDYEMVLQVGAYFDPQGLNSAKGRNLTEVVMRFKMPDVTGRYHMPFMLAPNSYSVWMAR